MHSFTIVQSDPNRPIFRRRSPSNRRVIRRVSPPHPARRAGRLCVGFQWRGTPPRNSLSLFLSSFPVPNRCARNNTKFVKAYDARPRSSPRHLPLNFTARISHRQSLQPQQRLTFRHTCSQFHVIVFSRKRIWWWHMCLDLCHRSMVGCLVIGVHMLLISQC